MIGPLSRRRCLRAWRVSAATVLVASLLTVPVSPVAAQSAGPVQSCPEIMPVADVRPGMRGTGYTVSQGTTPEPFAVEVIDVLRDGIAPDIDLIVVDTDSPAVREAGGGWFGMSGSPVYIGGRLVGALAYGLAFGPSSLAGLTPAEHMVGLLGNPTAPPPAEATDIDMPDDTQQAMVAQGGITAQQAAGGMRRLPLPLGLSGLQDRRFAQVAEALERADLGAFAVKASGLAADAAPGDPARVGPGRNLAAALSYGDLTAAGVGTTTAVCDGELLGFGHPMLWSGATTMSAHEADAVTIVDDPTFPPYKLANIGGVVGTVDQDRLTGIRARLGAAPPTVPITSSITNLDTGRSRDGRTDAVFTDFLADLATMHLFVNYDALVLDDLFFSGTSEVTWTVQGQRADGRPWSLTRGNRHADDFDLSSASIFDLFMALLQLQENSFEDITFTGVHYEAAASSPYRAFELRDRGVTVSTDGVEFFPAREGVFARPGDTIHVRVELDPYRDRQPAQTLEFALEVPDDAFGFGALELRSGAGGGDPFECLFFPEFCVDEGEDASFDTLLESLENQPRDDEVVASLTVFDDFFPGPDDPFLDDPFGPVEEPHSEPGFDPGAPPEPIAEERARVDEVVRGEVFIPVDVFPEHAEPCPPDEVPPAGFADVAAGNVHREAIDCAASHGIVRGVSEDPPLFAPGRPVTRAQAATFIANTLDAAGVELPEPAGDTFPDVAGVHADAIHRLAAAGVVEGREDGTFRPQQRVRRDQIASLLLRAVQTAFGGEFEPMAGPHFDDVTGGVHARNVDAAYELGLVRGEDGRFHPARDTRRDQMASLTTRLLGLLGGGWLLPDPGAPDGPPLPPGPPPQPAPPPPPPPPSGP